LIGHLVGSFGQATLVLTEKQKLALQQENNLRNKGYGAFSSTLDRQGATHSQPGQSLGLNSESTNQQFGFQHRFGSLQQQQLSLTDEQQLRILDQSKTQLFHEPQQQTSNNFPSSHPSHLLHQLSGEQQERFLNQFSHLLRPLLLDMLAPESDLLDMLDINCSYSSLFILSHYLIPPTALV